MKKRKVKKYVILIIIAILLIISGSIFYYFDLFDFSKETKTKKKTPIVETSKKKEYNASLIMVGDALIHSNLYLDARQEDGSYDFKPMLELTKPITSQYDLKYYNQETILGGSSLGLSSYPRFNSPT